MQIVIQDYQGRAYQIDSGQPDLLASWLLETFGRLKPDRATPLMVTVYPSWDPQSNGADWIRDSRMLQPITWIRSPEQLLDELGARLKAASASGD